ncbi:MAG: hypothetical protein MJ082_04090 [Clostridia bacterium]|nr:hypothetical protein [Clostridia bacterium]
MIIKQLSVFLENKQGRLEAAVEILASAGIDISALSLADTADYGVLRLLVDQPALAEEKLSESGIIVRQTRVNAVAMKDVPGGAYGILRLLSGTGISIEYMYACVGRVSGEALMVLRTDDTEKAEKLLEDNGFNNVSPQDIYRI